MKKLIALVAVLMIAISAIAAQDEAPSQVGHMLLPADAQFVGYYQEAYKLPGSLWTFRYKVAAYTSPSIPGGVQFVAYAGKDYGTMIAYGNGWMAMFYPGYDEPEEALMITQAQVLDNGEIAFVVYDMLSGAYININYAKIPTP